MNKKLKIKTISMSEKNKISISTKESSVNSKLLNLNVPNHADCKNSDEWVVRGLTRETLDKIKTKETE